MTAENISIFTPPAHHDLLALVLQIAVLLFTARVLGEIAQRLKQPSVIGEILAGILWGPSILGHFFPNIFGYIIPGNTTQGHLLEAVSMIGAMFLLLITGLETDLKLIRRHAKTALSVSFGGISVTFAFGFLLGQFLPDTLLVDPSQRIVFSLFIATAMSITAIPVIAKILIDLKLTRRDVGQTILAAGMSDDTVGWILLSIVAGLAASGSISAGSVLFSIVRVVALLVFSFTIGRWFVKKLFDFVQDKAISKDRLLSLIIVLTFLWGSITQALHLEAVLGAFIMGILFAQIPRLPNKVHHQLESIALGIFAPIFFATAGLKVNAKELMRPDLIIFTFLVILVATLGKVIGTYIGARLIGKKNHWTALSFGAALNARGAMEIIIATIGLSLGILSQEMFSIIVVMAITTSLLTPFALRWVLQHVPPSPEESKRLEKEKMAKDSPIMNIHRILLPIRYRENNPHLSAMQIIKSRILRNIGLSNNLSVTLLCVDQKSQKASHVKFLNQISDKFKEHETVNKTIESKYPTDEVIKECQKDYDMLVLGASHDRKNTQFVFSRTVDNLIRLAPCPSMVIHANEIPNHWTPNRILVLTDDSVASRNAADLAFMIASTGDETIQLINVIERDADNIYDQLHDEIFTKNIKNAEAMLKPFKKIGEMKNIPTEAKALTGDSIEKETLKAAVSFNADLIILGTHVRPVSKNLFLGTHIEYILKESSCPVITLNSV